MTESVTAMVGAPCYSATMSEAAAKDRILRAVEALPEDVTLEDAIEKLCLIAKIERGLQQADEGQTLSHDEAKQRLSK